MGSSKKLSNPKDAIGSRKSPVSTVPWPFVFAVGRAMTEGGCKYGRHNYRVIGVRASVYFDAACRHLAAWWEGEDIDPDSGELHIIKASACLAVLHDAMIQDKLNDDRPPKSPRKWLQYANELTEELLDRFPDPEAPYTEVGLQEAAIEDVKT